MSPAEAKRAVPVDFTLALVLGVVLFAGFGVGSLIARPIPETIYPTFAFRPEDGSASIGFFLLINMAWFALLSSGLISLVAWLARVGRRRSAVAVATISQCAMLAGTVVGGSGGFIGAHRWSLAAGLILGSAGGFAALGMLWSRTPTSKRPLLAGAALALVLVCDYFGVTSLGHFANLYGSVFAWLGAWTHVLLFLMLRAGIEDAGGLPSLARRALSVGSAITVVLAILAATGLFDRAFLHVRRVYDWRCPEAAAFVNLSRTAKLDYYKLRSALRARDGAAAVDTALLAKAGAPTRKLNVVVFVIDALRRDRVGAFNAAVTTTPTIDALAAEARVFTTAFSPSPTTGYSVISFLSGVLPEAAVQADGPPMFLPYVLRHFGWGTGSSSSFNGLHDMVPVLAGFTNDEIGFTDVTNAGTHSGAEYDTIVVDALIERLRATTTPRFEYVHLFATHGPFRPPDSLAQYDAAVASADAELARLIAALREAGKWDDTLLIVMGDHGEGLGEHGMYAHSQSLYVEQTAVPLIVRVPGGAHEPNDQAITLNVLPTIVMQALGGSWPIDTASDVAIQEFHIRSELVWRAIRNPPWSYHHRILDGVTELYNLDDDPGEARDIADDHPDVVTKMRAIEAGL